MVQLEAQIDLRPQHLKDLLQVSGDGDSPFLQSLASFCALVLEGRVPVDFGTTLVALEKRSGGVRPIAVGCTLRRLVDKIACQNGSG